MKTFLGIIATLFLGYIGYNEFYKGGETLKENRFEEYEQKFNAEIDSLKWNQESIKQGIQNLSFSVDTLKKGQTVIYKHVIEAGEKKTFIESVIEEF